MRQNAAKGIAGEVQAEGEAGPFGDQGGGGDAGHAPAQMQHEPEGEHDVEAVLPELQDQDAARALDADQPAGQRVEGDGARRAPDADREVLTGQGFDGGGSGGQAEGGEEEQTLGSNKGQTGGKGDEKGADQGGGAFRQVVRAVGLGGQAGGAHPQEAEGPVERGQDDRAKADSTYGGGEADLADYGGIDGTEQGDGGVRQHDGHGDAEDPGMGEAGHAVLVSSRSSGHDWPSSRGGARKALAGLMSAVRVIRQGSRGVAASGNGQSQAQRGG